MCQADDLKDAKALKAAMQLPKIRAALPKEVFQKSLAKSMFYLIYDFFMVLGSLGVMMAVVQSEFWAGQTMVVKGLITLAYWNFSGFFMWCLFVVGHDCGHTNFSEYDLLNDVLGHLCHAAILVPYYPWRLSHHRHHLYHNHAEKDYSHPWHDEAYYKNPENSSAIFFKDHKILRATFPIYGWFLYLWGMPDGSHFLPFPRDRMWMDSSTSDRMKCLLSTIILVIAQYGIYSFFKFDVADIAFYYLIPVGVFGWWLVTVTYLQHHTPDTKVFNDSNWSFLEAAFETVDRTFGFGIDELSHHITDGHVVHHLFFTKIPHYNLPEATNALQKYMSENGAVKMYRQEETYDFFPRVFQYFYSYGYDSVGPENVKKLL
jgi:omega-3 fatty acid desaturase (delta-15 desaturase)